MNHHPSSARRSISPAKARRHLPLICAASIALFGMAQADAQTIVKADNLDNLDLTTSWVGAVVPGAGNIALWDSTVTAANATLLGIDQSWKGIQITSPAGLVTIGAGNTLTLGSGGIDMATAAQDLTLNNNVTLLASTAQNWTVGAGRTLDVNGTYARGTGAMINFDTTAGGTINLATPAASTMLGGHSTINETDFAALDGSQNVATGATAVPAAYTANPNTGAALPTVGTVTYNVLDIVNSNTNAISAIRLGNTMTIQTGIRFNTAHTNNQDWVVDINSRNLNINNGGILVTTAIGAKNVIFNGSTGNLRLSANVDFYLHQHNTAGDLILNAQVTQPAGAGARLNKTGAGRVILQHSGNNYGGATFIHEGTLQIGNNGTSGAINAASAITNNGNLAFNRTDAVTFANAISGTGSVTQSGSGTLILSGATTYTGATNFNAGTVEFSALTGLGSGTALNFNGGTLRYAAGNTADISTRTVTFNAGASSLNTNGNNVAFANSVGNGGAGGFTKSGAGTLTLSAGNSYSGSTIITTGTLLANNASGSATGSGNVTVNSGGTLGGTGAIAGVVTVNSGGILAPGASVESLDVGGATLGSGAILNFEFASLVSHDVLNVTNAAGLVLNGGGMNLYAENTLTGWTTAGTYNLFSYSGGIGGTGTSALSVLNPQGGFTYAFGSTGSVVTLTITAAGVVSNWIFDGGDSWNTAGRWSAAVPNGAGETGRFNTTLSAPATVTLDGAKTVGALVFDSATNGYTIDQGSGGTLTINNNANPGSLQVLTGSHVISAPVALVSNTTSDVAATASLALSGGVSGAGVLTKEGGGTLLLTGTNSYASTTINAGAVQFDSAAALGSGGIGFGGGTLRWAGGNTADVSLSAVTFNVGGGTFDTNGNNVLLTASIGNAGVGGFTKAGAGVLTLSAASTYTGTTAVNGGTLSISANDQLGDAATGAAVSFNGGTLATTATFNLDNGGVNVRPLSFGASGGTIETATGTTLTVAGALSGGALTKTGDGTLLLTGSNLAYTGAVTLTGGTVILAGGDPNGQSAIGIGPITFNGGTLQMNGHVGSTTPNYGNLGSAISVPTGQTGTLRMPSRGGLASAITGDGTLNLVVTYVRGDFNANASAFTGTINVSSAAGVSDFRINNGNGFANARLHLGSGVYMAQIFNPPIGAPFTTTQNIGQLSGDAGSFLSGNPVNGRFVNWSVGGLNTNSTFAGAITNATGAARLTKVGTGNFTLTGTSTFTGGTFASDGTLTVASDGALGSILGSGLTLNPTVSAAVHFTALTPFIGSLASSGAGASSVVLGDATAGTPSNLSVGGNAATATFAGVISDGTGSNAAAIGTLTKAGNGTLILSGANTYTGGSVVSGGVLQAVNTLAFPTYATPGKVIVNSGGIAAVNVLGAGEWTLADVDTIRTSATFNAGSALGLDTTNSAGGFDYTTPFGGILGIAKLGTDSLTLSGVNTYTGATTVLQGTLNAVNNQSLGSSSAAGLVLNPATGTALVNFTSLAPAVGSLASSGAGTSSLVLGDAIGGAPTVLTFGGNNSSSTYAGAITDLFGSNAAAIGSLVKVGTGTQTLSGINDYTGTTTVNAGTLQALQPASLLYGYGNPGKIIVNATGTLAVNVGAPAEWDSSSIDTLRANATFNAGSALGFDTTSATGAFAYASNIADGAGAMGVTKLGANTLALSGVNTYTGGTRLKGGILALDSLGAIGSTGPISFEGGTLQYTATNTSDNSGRFSTAADQDFSIDTNSQTVTLASAVSSAGGTLTKLGAGILNLNGAQSYDTLTTSAGTTNVNGSFTGGTTTVNANAETNFGASQTLAALNIGTVPLAALGGGPSFGAAIVPEPGSLGLLMVGALGMLARRRRAR